MKIQTPFWVRRIEGADKAPVANDTSASETAVDDKPAQEGSEKPTEEQEPQEEDPAEEDPADASDDSEDSEESWKKKSRIWENRSKHNLAKLKDLQKTCDAQNETIAELTEAKSELEAKLLKNSIAMEFGLTEEQAELFLHGDADRMRKQAEALKPAGAEPVQLEAGPRSQGHAMSSQGNAAGSRAYADGIYERLMKHGNH